MSQPDLSSPCPDPRVDGALGGPRDPGDDFFCLRYRVWYPSLDCAFRTRFRTSAGCLNCDQGRFNHRRHAHVLRGVRWSGPSNG